MGRVLGFDRKLKLPWLNAVAWQVKGGASDTEIRSFLDEFLEEEVKGPWARKKTTTVLTRIWVKVDKDSTKLQKEALEILPIADPGTELCLHWGMMLLAYPFFRDIATIIGRLLSLQKTVAWKEIQRRVVEKWGDTETVRCAAYRVIRSIEEMGLLSNPEHGVYCLAPKQSVPANVQLWLLEVLLRAEEVTLMPVEQLFRLPSSFPFSVDITFTELRRCNNFEITRQSLDLDMVEISY